MNRRTDRSGRGPSRRRVVAGGAAALALMRSGLAGAGEPGATGEAAQRSHGISTFGELKYGPDFRHFDYVDPHAPKGGALRLYGIDSFDSLNPYILKGVFAEGLALIADTLMERAMDEPDALYPRVARSVEIPADRSWVAFDLDKRARFHDGSPMTAEDAAFTFETLMTKGHPSYRLLLGGVAKAAVEGPHRVKFLFRRANERDLPLIVAGLPVLSRAYYAKVPFDQTTLTPPLSSGPYRVDRVEPGRYIVYRRVADWWGKDLPAARGRYNFDTIRYDYFRDRDIAFQAFFGGSYDFREEFTSRNWATQYDGKPAVQQGLVVRETLPDATPSGVQAFFFNLRRTKFQDRRVRAALDYAFDFEWTNKTLFYGLYKRTNSMFENSELAAHDPPSPADLALLEPLRGTVPPEVFEKPFRAPVTDGSGFNRDNLKVAARLLNAAGWTVKDGKRTDAEGEPFRIEFLLFESSFQRVINPYIRNLLRLGIDGSIRIVDVANYQHRRRVYDFDVVVNRFVQPLTPGIEQINYFGSQAADMPGSNNLAGIKDPAVDTLIGKVMTATTRAGLIAAVRALDRVLMWNRYCVPQWYKGSHSIAYWNKFSRPGVKPKYDLAVEDTWWFDAEKAEMLAAGKAPPKPKPPRI